MHSNGRPFTGHEPSIPTMEHSNTLQIGWFIHAQHLRHVQIIGKISWNESVRHACRV